MTSTIKNKKGFSIVSVLVASAIGLIVLAGTTRIITFSLNASQAAKSSATELELLLSLSKLLANETQCKGNLKPNRILNSIISRIDSSNPLTIIEEGQSFKNNLEIVKIDLMGATGNPRAEIVNRKFVVYYNKKNIRTLDDKPCNANSVEGCYFYSCDLKYKTEDVATNPNVEVCDVQNCSSTQMNSTVGVSCDDGQFLKGFDDSGNKICLDLTEVYSEIGSCATGEYLSGFDNKGQKICVTLASANTPQNFDKNKPRAKGIILQFHNWPNEQETKHITTSLEKAGLQKTMKIERFKVWVFEGPESDKILELKQLCEGLMSVSSLESCEPDYLADITAPSVSYIREIIEKGKSAYEEAEKRVKYARQALKSREEKANKIFQSMATDKGLAIEKKRLRTAKFALKQAKKELKRAIGDSKIKRARERVKRLEKLVEGRKKRVENRKKWFQDTKAYVENNQDDLLESRKNALKKAVNWFESVKQILKDRVSKYAKYLPSQEVETLYQYVQSLFPDEEFKLLEEILTQQSGNIRTCNTISFEFGMFKGKLSDYWAQEMIGSDLLREKLERATSIQKHLVEVFDMDFLGHHIGVRNLVSDEGRHAVLPEIGDRAGITLTPSGSSTLMAADKLLTKAEQNCAAYKDSSDSSTTPDSSSQNSINNNEIVASDDPYEQCKTNIFPSFINNSLVWFGSIYTKSFESISSPSVIVVSSGNFAKIADFHPLAHLLKGTNLHKVKASKDFNAILVGSMAPDGRRSGFSNFHEEVHIMAPSDSFLTSAYKDQRFPFGGTSGAAPLVTGSLAGFEWLSGYHPTAAEAKILLEKTAIPTLDANKVPQLNGVGMVNSYKLGMVGELLKITCGKNVSCFKEKIQKEATYNFPEDQGLLQAVNNAFPHCSSNQCNRRSNRTCEDKAAVFERLRKAAFLNPSNGELWRNIACIYDSANFTKNAQGAMSTYKATFGNTGTSLYAACEVDADCTHVPACASKNNLNMFLPANKNYVAECQGRVLCNNKCRCSSQEFNLPTEEQDVFGKITSTCMNTQCVSQYTTYTGHSGEPIDPGRQPASESTQ